MSDYTIPGYDVLGAVDTTMADYDSAGLVLLMWAQDGTGLYVLWAGGCNCGSQGGCGCGINDDLVACDAQPVSDLLATAQDMYDAAASSDDPDAMDAVRNALIAAQVRLRPASPLAIEG
jgi:hypothetical protein